MKFGFFEKKKSFCAFLLPATIIRIYARVCLYLHARLLYTVRDKWMKNSKETFSILLENVKIRIGADTFGRFKNVKR